MEDLNVKILFITANRLGDAVLTTGVLGALVETYPEASFTIACGPFGSDVFRATPRLERLIVMKKKKANGHWVDLWRACVGTRWDLIVDLRNSLVSRLLWRKKLLTHGKSGGQHKVIENAAILGISPPPAPRIWIAEDAQAEAEKIVGDGPEILALGPTANWALKQWPVRHFIGLVQELTGEEGALEGARVMVLAGEKERPQIQELLDNIPDERRIEVIGHDVQTAAACLTRARLYVGNDSGLMHLAAALNVPTLGLFGPGVPEVYRPWGEKCAFVATPETREQLLAQTGRATLMESLSVEAVARAAEDLLRKTS